LNIFLQPAFFSAAVCNAGFWSSVETRAVIFSEFWRILLEKVVTLGTKLDCINEGF
jgi:hypothetical protein